MTTASDRAEMRGSVSMSEPVPDRGDRRELDRRTFLQDAAAGSLPLLTGAAGLALADEPGSPARFPGLIVRQREPRNLEFPFSSLDRFLTPNERFYVRNHFPVPKLEAKTWKLKVEGGGDKEVELSYDDLRKMEKRTVTALLECAGNGRMYLTPKVKGVQWDLGAVGTAKWTGVPLSAVLKRAGIPKDTAEVIFEGADSGEIKDEPKSPGVIHFARSLSRARALAEDVILALQMNGKDLPPDHGFPVRLVVPGCYGVASVKWLSRIIFSKERFAGFFQSLDYTYWRRINGVPSLTPITSLQVKAEIARPGAAEVVKAGTKYRVHGAAWTGDSEVTKVE